MIVNSSRVAKLSRFRLTTADATSVAIFYESAFGCRRVAKDRLSGREFERLMGVVGGADRITLNLGSEVIELVQFDVPGNPYPPASSSSDLVFQHFAIVVVDMSRALQRLSSVAGWSAISSAGPQRLPASSGSDIAFKFRDPEGHPLELLEFPSGKQSSRPGMSPDDTCLGIDHSAISVADSADSIAFYQSIGLTVSGRSFNHGAEQQRLDDVPDARVDVTALAPHCPKPHLELLCYRTTQKRRGLIQRSNDIANTQLVFELCGASNALDSDLKMQSLRDPDGHAFLIADMAAND